MKTVSLERRFFVTVGNSGSPFDSEFHWLLRQMGIDYIQAHEIDAGSLLSIVEVIKRIPTAEDKNTIRLL